MSSINTHRIDTTKVMVEGGPGLGCVNAYDVAADATALPLSQWSNTLTCETVMLRVAGHKDAILSWTTTRTHAYSTNTVFAIF